MLKSLGLSNEQFVKFFWGKRVSYSKPFSTSCISINRRFIFLKKVSHDFVAPGLIYFVGYSCMVTNELLRYIFSIVDTGEIY